MRLNTEVVLPTLPANEYCPQGELCLGTEPELEPRTRWRFMPDADPGHRDLGKHR